MNDGGRALTQHAKLGFVFQSFRILPHLTVAQNVELPLVLLSVARTGARRACYGAAAAVGLGDRGIQRAARAVRR